MPIWSVPFCYVYQDGMEKTRKYCHQEYVEEEHSSIIRVSRRVPRHTGGGMVIAAACFAVRLPKSMNGGVLKYMEEVNLSRIPKDGGRMLEELGKGNMVIVRSKNDFLYIMDFDRKFHMFSHTPGAPGGGQKQFDKDEKHTAVIKKLADLSDHVYMAEFDKGLNLYGVMVSAEEGILSLYPGDDRDSDADIEFIIPEKNKTDDDKQ
ncbi:hypothetical protein SAMN02745823_00781 [Sporobacter termitidis DSM 10068]|uniref:Uncharacterized protein n=2 Tax=Sporobacter TaxID=44748 RepID=A0A1M5VDY7_9FIRM|nr:hypothetical protein SAMN02745823_00781 [Sporobacter termitidis DSM 10068]